MDTKLPMELKKQEQVQTGLPLLKNGDEKYELAVTGRKIVNSTIEELKEVLRLAMLKLGIRGNNLPNDEEKQILIKHVVENYGAHTCAEISLAFDLAISGKLDVDAKAYENFSCLYVSSIMNAYREWSRELAYKHRQKQESLALPYEHRSNLSDEEMEQWISEWDIEKINSVKDVNYVPTLFYEFLSSHGRIDISSEDKNRYLENARLQRKKEYEKWAVELNSSLARRLLDEYKKNELSDSTFNEVVNLAKKMIVFDYLKRKANELPEMQKD